MRHCITLVALLLALTLSVSSCSTLYVKRVTFRNHPVAVRIFNKIIDDETLEYVVVFRNVGREIITFDYTIADEPGVPHVDFQGPNSGLIENLYPGAEIEVANPTERLAVWITLGTVLYGKHTKEEIMATYQPGNSHAADSLEIPLP